MLRQWVTNLDFNEARDDGVAVASAGLHANHLHFAPDRQSRQHLTTFLPANQQCLKSLKAIILKCFFAVEILIYNQLLTLKKLPSVLWRCWLGGRKDIRLIKKLSGEVLAWLSVWSKVQMICIWSSCCHCHPIISCSSKIQNGLPFWCQLTQVVLEKRPLNGCSVVVAKAHCPARYQPVRAAWLGSWH